MNRIYKALKKQSFSRGEYKLVPIRLEDRYDIMKWRNEQIYHLRQNKPLTEEEQDRYFNTIVTELFSQEKPDQILFSYIESDKCIGYGGLVHINWVDKNAEISFIMNTSLQKDFFEFHWTTYLGLIEEVSFVELGMHKIYTYAFDLRPQLYSALEKAKYSKEAVLFQHAYFEGSFIDIIIHSKVNVTLYLRKAQLSDVELTYIWATDPKVRMYAFTKENIGWENHKKWFFDKLNHTDCEYYIFHEKGEDIGSIRFDINENASAMISYLIDPSFHGKGFGKTILIMGLERLKFSRKEVKNVIGFVQKENIASLKIFENLGFQRTLVDDLNLKFEKEL
jgi:RimJ/RimL family protein N-acetyltransferase